MTNWSYFKIETFQIYASNYLYILKIIEHLNEVITYIVFHWLGNRLFPVLLVTGLFLQLNTSFWECKFSFGFTIFLLVIWLSFFITGLLLRCNLQAGKTRRCWLQLCCNGVSGRSHGSHLRSYVSVTEFVLLYISTVWSFYINQQHSRASTLEIICCVGIRLLSGQHWD